MERYFGVIFARDADAMRSLQKFELDVFPQTAKRSDRDPDFPFSIDGLLTPADIEAVVKAGYRVQVQESADKRSRAAEAPAEFGDWLQTMEAELTQERAADKKKATLKKVVTKKVVTKKVTAKKAITKKTTTKK
jgi:hypothetical protein